MVFRKKSYKYLIDSTGGTFLDPKFSFIAGKNFLIPLLFNSAEEFVDYWLHQWIEKLTPILIDPNCCSYFKRMIWIELLDYFITIEHPQFENFETLVLSSSNRLDFAEINAFFQLYKIAPTCLAFWISCLEGYDTWILESQMMENLPSVLYQRILLLFKEIFVEKIFIIIGRL